MDPTVCSSNVANVDSGYTTHTEMVIEAISTINDGNGVDIDGIFEFIKERYEVREKFRKRLKDKLKKLVTQSKLEMVGNRYKILDGIAATQTLNPEDSTNPQDLPTTSLTSEEILKIIDGYLKVVAVAEHIEFEAKEAFEVADRSNQLFKESTTILQLAREIFDLCAKGEKIFLR